MIQLDEEALALLGAFEKGRLKSLTRRSQLAWFRGPLARRRAGSNRAGVQASHTMAKRIADHLHACNIRELSTQPFVTPC